MALKKRKFKISALFILFFLIVFVRIYPKQELEQYLEIELKRLEETYTLLDTFAEQIWPGWDNYMDVEFQVQFPNLVFLIVNPRKEVPKGYDLVQGRTVRGKKIYLNRRKELPIKLEPPLMGGGGGGMTIRIMLSQKKITPEEAKKIVVKKAKEDPLNIYWNLRFMSENQIFVYVHEFFHGFQAKAWTKMSEPSGENCKITVNTEYSTYSEIEGQALLGAYTEKDDTKALEYMKDYIVARELKQKHMTPGAIIRELWNSVAEGTANYSNTKMAMLIRDLDYKPKMSQKKDDPFFFDFQYVDEYIKCYTIGDLSSRMGMTLDTLLSYYTYGLVQCLLLDRFVPGWKKGFFENDRNLDEVMRAFLKLSEEEKKHIAEGFQSKYQFDELYAKHGAVIKNRDDAIDLIKSRKGKKYIVDLGRTKELFNITPRGKSVRIGVKQIFLHGIEKLTLGEIEMVSKDTPVYRWIRRVEWVETEAKEEEKGYELKYGEKVGDVYKNVTFTTNGFTLKAPEVKIKERGNKVRIIILSKVSR